MMKVALTGGIATGKSTVAARFAQLGVPVIDADRLAREVVAPGTDGLRQVVDRFGARFVDASGRLDRKALGKLVFDDPQARADLEAIVHPLVYAAIDEDVRRLTVEGLASYVIADIPLLFETGHAADLDRIVVAACDPDEQVRRIMARDGAAEQDARKRLAAQWPIARKVQLADYVIDTSGPIDATWRQVDDLHATFAGGRA